MSSRESLDILDALENLVTILEIDSLNEIEVTEDAHIIAHPATKSSKIDARSGDKTIDAVKETLKVVYSHLRTFYGKKNKTTDTKRLVEGINTIMVLVGEAAKKLERYSNIFQKKITNLKEYQDLQNFYRNKVIKETYKEFSNSILEPGMNVEEDELDIYLESVPYEGPSSQYILDDINIVKKDSDYELFYLKNEEGRNFYTEELARNIKQSLDFNEFTKEYFSEDPLLQIKNLEDKSIQVLASHILNHNKKLIEGYFKESMANKGMEIISLLNKALMALMLAANSKNLIRQFSLKGCYLYFADFQQFLREILQSKEYQKFMTYSVPASKPFFTTVLDLIQSLCIDIYSLGEDEAEIKKVLKEIVSRENEQVFKTKVFSEFLAKAYSAYEKGLQKHPNGPLFKTLDLLLDETEKVFDPIMQGNIPGPEYSLEFNGQSTLALRMPSPVRQEFIHHCELTDEFKGFLRAYQSIGESNKHLIVNFQDRTSWKEHPRCTVLEELQRNAEFAKTLFVITLPKNTEFYLQESFYEDLDDKESFIEQLKIHLRDESTGFYFTPQTRKLLFSSFIDEYIDFIDSHCFKGENKISKENRCIFIELVYLGISLKLIDEIKPRSFSFLSKDSLDVGCCEFVSLIGFLAMIQNHQWHENEKEECLRILFSPTLLARERIIHFDRFEKLEALLRFLEKKPFDHKALKKFFSNGVLDSQIVFPKPK